MSIPSSPGFRDQSLPCEVSRLLGAGAQKSNLALGLLHVPYTWLWLFPEAVSWAALCCDLGQPFLSSQEQELSFFGVQAPLKSTAVPGSGLVWSSQPLLKSVIHTLHCTAGFP